MPTVEYGRTTVDCDSGERLRSVLLDAGESVQNGPRLASCRGHGTCGTCAVEVVEGDAGNPTRRERMRPSVPPHDPESGLRVAVRCA